MGLLLVYRYPGLPASSFIEHTLIRPFGLRDCLKLQRLSRRSVPLQMERHLTQAQSPLWAAVGAPAPWYGTGAATYLYQQTSDPHSLQGFIQAIKRLGRPEADITYIAPRHDAHPHAAACWQTLLEFIAYDAGEHGIQRLYLCLESESLGT